MTTTHYQFQVFCPPSQSVTLQLAGGDIGASELEDATPVSVHDQIISLDRFPYSVPL